MPSRTVHVRSNASLLADLAYVDHLNEVGSPILRQLHALRAKASAVQELRLQADTLEAELWRDAGSFEEQVIEKNWTRAEIAAAKKEVRT